MCWNHQNLTTCFITIFIIWGWLPVSVKVCWTLTGSWKVVYSTCASSGTKHWGAPTISTLLVERVAEWGRALPMPFFPDQHKATPMNESFISWRELGDGGMGGYNEDLWVSRQEMFFVLGGMRRNIQKSWDECKAKIGLKRNYWLRWCLVLFWSDILGQSC